VSFRDYVLKLPTFPVFIPLSDDLFRGGAVDNRITASRLNPFVTDAEGSVQMN
jgi:hypothetical protein